MRLANHQGRATLVEDVSRGHDIETVSDRAFGPDPGDLFDRWDEFSDWLSSSTLGEATVPIDRTLLGPPSPRPRQVFAIGLNYREHAHETDQPVPDAPVVFTKFPSCITGPVSTVRLPPGGNTDWEVELVTIIGRAAHAVPVDSAWAYVAGLTVGQDLSERREQTAGDNPQFSMAKSHTGFGPTGPWLVSLDELGELDDVELGCRIGTETVQSGRIGDQIFAIPELISALSRVVTLLPGDLIFTGTPAGVGRARKPERYLRRGDLLTSWVGGIGELQQTFV